MVISAALLMGAALMLGSGQAFAGTGAGFAKLDYGDDLYGLPNTVTPLMGVARTWDKLNYGDELYGLPNTVTPLMEVPRAWDKLDLGDDLYGLPYLLKFHS
jgi:hypothetical protein